MPIDPIVAPLTPDAQSGAPPGDGAPKPSTPPMQPDCVGKSHAQGDPSGNVYNADTLRNVLGGAHAAAASAAAATAAPSDMALASGPVAFRDGHVVELTRYQQDGKVAIDSDTVTQQIGRGKTAEYSLSQLAAHSKDPEYFENTMRYAAKHGDSVRIDVHNGVARVTDATLEHRLPQNRPLRDPILHAAVKHDVDPVLLAAVGVQETHLGADYLGPSIGYNKTTHRGDVEPDSKDGHGYGPFQLDDAKRPGEVPRPQGELDLVARSVRCGG